MSAEGPGHKSDMSLQKDQAQRKQGLKQVAHQAFIAKDFYLFCYLITFSTLLGFSPRQNSTYCTIFALVNLFLVDESLDTFKTKTKLVDLQSM